MAITSADIENQSFSNDFRGYNVDEVDEFLEFVANEIDILNGRVAELEGELADALAQAAAAPAPVFASDPTAYIAPEPVEEEVEEVLDEIEESEADDRDARIAELEAQLAEKTADGSAIAEALIVAQRAADEIISKAKASAVNTQNDAEEEARHIIDKANAEKQRILDTISTLQVEREEARSSYQKLLRDFIEDASQKLVGLGGERTVSASSVTAANPVIADEPEAPAENTIPALDLETITATYTTPQMNLGASAPAAAPKPSRIAGKDLSGYGDAIDDFGFDDLD